MPKQKCSYDLHLHSCWSYDATTPVKAYFAEARRRKLRCIAIADHWVLDGRAEIRKAAREFPDVRYVMASEFTLSTRFGNTDFLCYGFPRKRNAALKKVFDESHRWQRRSGRGTSQAMQSIGFPFSSRDRLSLLRTYRPQKAIRMQGNTLVKNQVLCSYCIAKGYIESPDDYLNLKIRLQEAGPPNPQQKASKVIPLLKQAGVLVVIAHPVARFQGMNRARMEEVCEACQVDGIECAHPWVPQDHGRFYRKFCEEKGLVSTAGSDCHEERHLSYVASYPGKERWLDEFLERLNCREDSRRKNGVIP